MDATFGWTMMAFFPPFVVLGAKRWWWWWFLAEEDEEALSSPREEEEEHWILTLFPNDDALSADLIASLCVVFVCTTHAQLILVKKQQKNEKERNKKRNKISLMFFSSSLLKSGKNMGTENVDQRTNRRPKDRTDTSLISLSLSLFCVVYASIHSSSSRKKKRYRITRPKKAQRILPPSPSFSQFALSRWCCCFIREREDEESEHPPKEEKQTNKGRVKQKISKSANVAFFSEQERQRF